MDNVFVNSKTMTINSKEPSEILKKNSFRGMKLSTLDPHWVSEKREKTVQYSSIISHRKTRKDKNINQVRMSTKKPTFT